MGDAERDRPVATSGSGGDPAGARLLDVRLLLSLRAGGAGTDGWRGPRSGGEPWRLAVADPHAGDAPDAPVVAPGRGAPDVHDVACELQRAVHLRRRIPGDD